MNEMRFDRQVSVRMSTSKAQSAAEKLSQGKAKLAIELVGYDAELKAAMQYVFGSSFICPVLPKTFWHHDDMQRKQ